MLSEPLPNFLEQFLPSTFLDLRVFYRVVPVEDAVMCALDAKVCSDGSMVGRTGAKCEFACPGQVCTDDVTVCVDGTQVSRTGNSCEFVCPTTGSTSISAKNLTQILAIQKAFGPHIRHSCGYDDTGSTVDQLRTVNITHHLVLIADETWDSYCLHIFMSEVPTDCFPDVYLGARVFYSYGVPPTGALPAGENFSLVFGSVFVVLFVLCACCACRRVRKSQKFAGFQRLPVESSEYVQSPVMMPMMMPQPAYMVPAEFDIENMNGEQMPYEPVMIPVGYHHPIFTHPQQPVWFVPPQQQRK